MPSFRPHVQLVLLPVVVLWMTSARGQERISLSEAVQLALKNNPQLQLEEAKVAESEATRKSIRGLYGPKLMVEGNIMVWDSELPFEMDMPEMDFDQLEAKCPGISLMQPTLPCFADMFNLGNIRDQITGQLNVTLAQPLTPLLPIHNGYLATKHMAEASALDQRSKRAEVAFEVSQAYLQLMQAQKFAEVAKTGVDQVAAHLKRARHYYTAGMIGKQDVLKAQLEHARAKEGVIKTRYSISLARSAVALQLGLPLDRQIVPTEEVVDPPQPFSLSLEECIRRAEEQRSELKSMQHKQQAARAGERRAMWELGPDITAVATYQHTRGQGTFFPENAFFVGGMLKWELWGWGHRYYKMKAAQKKISQAQVGARLLRDGIRIQTKKAYLDLQQSREALAVARAAIQEAAENFRIEEKRFEANANTSTDVLDAHLALTRAKLSYTTALYGYYIARAGLNRAMGQW